MPPYNQGNPAPAVSPWFLFFAATHLLIRHDVTGEVPLNAIQHPYDRAMMHVVRADSEKAAAMLKEPEADDADVGAAHHRGKISSLDFL